MHRDDPSKSSSTDLKLLVVLLALGMIGFHLSLALSGRGIGRDQHLGTAIHYAQHGIDLLNPVIIGANANGAPTPLEFPLWQAITGALMRVFGSWYGWGTVVALLFHVSSIWPVFHLAKRMFSTRCAWWALVLYLAQPLTFLYGGYASTDGMSAYISIWFIYLAAEMLERQSWRWWVAASIVGALSATTKAPFFFVAGLTAFFWLLQNYRTAGKAWLQLTAVGAFSVAAFLIWNHHCNRCYNMAEMPGIDLRLSRGTGMTQWWFGDLAARLSVSGWARGAWRSSTILLGSIGLVILPLAGLFLPGTRPLRWWLVSGLAAMLIFTSLILIHWHYYYIFSVPVALLGARSLIEFEPALLKVFRNHLLRTGVFGLVAVAALAQALQAAHFNLLIDPHPVRCAKLIEEHTLPEDKLVVWGGAWSVPLVRAYRNGVIIVTFAVVNDASKLARL
ncbi:MAG TPA: glycosyltransferase family 39 protein, partial [Candidatus Acidoferrum sp.]|nr:glycosyltransferase family 39 protein [Candidatus Acidoferrum sp.]